MPDIALPPTTTPATKPACRILRPTLDTLAVHLRTVSADDPSLLAGSEFIVTGPVARATEALELLRTKHHDSGFFARIRRYDNPLPIGLDRYGDRTTFEIAFTPRSPRLTLAAYGLIEASLAPYDPTPARNRQANPVDPFIQTMDDLQVIIITSGGWYGRAVNWRNHSYDYIIRGTDSAVAAYLAELEREYPANFYCTGHRPIHHDAAGTVVWAHRSASCD
jgi:hypothetical protein